MCFCLVYLVILDDVRFFIYVCDNMIFIYDDMLKRILCVVVIVDVFVIFIVVDEDIFLFLGMVEEI